MRIIRNNFIPSRGFKAINLFGILFVREDAAMTERTSTTRKSMKEMLYVPFYLWYLAEWLVRLVQCRDMKKAYRSISFEREAYANEKDMGYLGRRRRYSWTGYLKGGGA